MNTSINLEKIRQAALAGDVMTAEDPWFFVMIKNQEIMHETALLADVEDMCVELLVVCFASMDVKQSVLDTTLAMSRMMQVVKEMGMQVRLERWLSRVFEDPAYSELAGAMGVPEGYYCIGGFAVLKDEREKEIVKHREDVFAVIV